MGDANWYFATISYISQVLSSEDKMKIKYLNLVENCFLLSYVVN